MLSESDIKELDMDTVKVFKCLANKITPVIHGTLTLAETEKFARCDFCSDRQFCNYIIAKSIEY